MARFPLVPTAPEPERAVLVGVEWRDNAWPLDRSLDELERLAHTAGAQCVARLSQRLVKPYPKSFIGSGAFSGQIVRHARSDDALVSLARWSWYDHYRYRWLYSKATAWSR